MKLYYASSVCSLAVRIIIHELALSCEYEAVDLKTKKTETQDNYFDINGKGSVPALVLDNHEVLTENAVILQYLADTHHASHLLPALGTMQRYRVLEWLNFIATDLHRYCAPLFWSRFSEETKQEVFTPILFHKLSWVDKHLQKHQYLMGEQFTLADSYLLVIIIWLAKLQIPLEPWPNLYRYYLLMKKKASVAKALKEEGLFEY